MNKKQLRHAFNTIIEWAENAKCENLHHPKKYRHKAGEVCPAEYNMHRQAHIVREYMKSEGI